MKKIKVFIVVVLLMIMTGSGILTYNVNISNKTLFNITNAETSVANSMVQYVYVADYDLEPEFDPYVYEYTIKISPNTDHLKMTYQPQSKYGRAELQGNENLQNGSVIYLTGYPGEGNNTTTYKFNIVYTNSKLVLKIVIVLLIIIITFAIISLFLYVLYKKGIIHFNFKSRKDIGKENYVK